jgi:Uncharacterized protein conserved in bacteria (DUF2344)
MSTLEAADAAFLSSELPDRLRIRFSKLGKICWTSHRDVARMWERALRRIGLRVAWSAGFSPHPLVSFGLALPTGCTSRAEYLDVRLELGQEEWASGALAPRDGAPGAPASPIPVAELPERLSGLLPDGVDVQATGWVFHGTGSLQQDVTSCSWELEVLGVATEQLAARVEQVLGAPSINIRRERKGRTVVDDLRPSVLALAVAGDRGGTPCLRAELASHPRGVRPRELLDGLGSDLALIRGCRTHQWIERDGARWEPLTMSTHEPDVDAPHAQERAS